MPTRRNFPPAQPPENTLKSQVKFLQEELKKTKDALTKSEEEANKWAKQESINSTRLKELKEKLFHSEQKVARLLGYLDRVAEDDQARDGYVQVEEGETKATVRPVRQGSNAKWPPVLYDPSGDKAYRDETEMLRPGHVEPRRFSPAWLFY